MAMYIVFGVLLLIVLGIILLDASGWADPTSVNRNNMVFEKKNQDYGAYKIRRNYSRSIIVATLVGIGFMTFAVLAPALKIWLSDGEEEVVELKVTEVNLTPPPPVDENNTPPPPPPPPPPPTIKTIAFVPPKVVDEEVPEEINMSQEDKETQIATVDQEGSDDPLDVVIEPPAAVEPAVEEVYTVVQEMPEFSGGDVLGYLRKTAVYPPYERDLGIQGTVWVEFVVNKEGKVDKAKVVKSPPNAPGLEKEALRAVNALPSFKPGRQAGRPVPVRFTVPIKFSIK